MAEYQRYYQLFPLLPEHTWSMSYVLFTPLHNFFYSILLEVLELVHLNPYTPKLVSLRECECISS